MIIIDIILWVALVLLVFVVLLLVMPVQFKAAGAASDHDGVDWRVRGAWGLGFLILSASPEGVRIRLLGITVHRGPLRSEEDDDTKAQKRRRKQEKKAAKKAKAAEKGDPERPRRSFRWAAQRRQLLWRIAMRFVGALHLRGHVDGVVGLESPEHTAQLQQALVALDGVLPAGFLTIEVNWVEAEVDVDAAVGGWIVPLQILGIALLLYLSPPTRRALRAA